MREVEEVLAIMDPMEEDGVIAMRCVVQRKRDGR